MDAILPAFEETYGITVDVVAVGTGEALALGRSGDVDVLLVHAPPLEERFMLEGYGVDRRAVMANEFVILGPSEDPAGIRGLTDGTMAVARIKDHEASFVSRGDNSGTHVRELALWEAAGVQPQGDWYLSAGQGMGATLTVAEQEQAYVLADRGTYLKRSAGGLDLALLVEGGPNLLNPYHVINVNPTLHAGLNAEEAQLFGDWIISPVIQAAIDGYQVDGQQLFRGTAGETP